MGEICFLILSLLHSKKKYTIFQILKDGIVRHSEISLRYSKVEKKY